MVRPAQFCSLSRSSPLHHNLVLRLPLLSVPWERGCHHPVPTHFYCLFSNSEDICKRFYHSWLTLNSIWWYNWWLLHRFCFHGMAFFLGHQFWTWSRHCGPSISRIWPQTSGPVFSGPWCSLLFWRARYVELWTVKAKIALSTFVFPNSNFCRIFLS